MRRAARRPDLRITAMSEPQIANSFATQLADALAVSWPAIARPNQLPPPGDWQVWLRLAGIFPMHRQARTRGLGNPCHDAAADQADPRIARPRRPRCYGHPALDLREPSEPGARVLRPDHRQIRRHAAWPARA